MKSYCAASFKGEPCECVICNAHFLWHMLCRLNGELHGRFAVGSVAKHLTLYKL